MSLDTVLLIGFSGILSGILMLFLTSDNQIFSSFKQIVVLTKRISNKTTTTSDKYLQHPNFDKNIDSRTYAFFIDVSFVLILLAIHFFVIQGNQTTLYIIITICIFFIPFFLFSRSIGELFMHIKIYDWEGEKLNKPVIAVSRYICKILLFPLNLFTIFNSNIFIEDLLFKTYQTQE